MSKDSSAKYYQSNEKRLQRKVSKRYQTLSKVKKKRKKVTIWLWTIQKSIRKWKTKPCWVYKQIS